MQRLFHEMDTGKKYLILFTLLGIMGLLLSFKLYGYENTWRLWQIETLMPPFSDFRLLPGTAETVQRGIDPTIRNPGDPYKRIYNYPRLWNIFFRTRFTQDDVVWLGVLVLIFYYLSVISFPDRITTPALWLFLLLVFSPAAMLLYERGNVDLIIFSLIVVALLFYDFSLFLSAGALLFAAMLKVFPIFGLVIFLQKGWKSFWRTALLVVIGFFIYFIWSFSSMVAAWQTTMRGWGLSYGTNVLVTRYYISLLSFFEQTRFSIVAEKTINIIPYLVGGLVVGLVVLKSIKDNLIFSMNSERNFIAFQMGAFIYVGTFLLGNNWDYRLVFLLLTIPQLGSWLETIEGKERRVVILAVVLILLSTWHFLITASITYVFGTPEVGFIIDEFANWLLFSVLLYIGYASFPLWVKDFVRNLKMLQWVTR